MNRYGVNLADHLFTLCRHPFDELSNQAAPRRDILAEKDSFQRLRQLVVGGDLANLIELIEHVRGVGRIHGVLVLEFGDN